MAKKVTEAIATAMAKQNARMTYPWETWTDGQWWHLEQGVDFYVEAGTFRTQAKTWGKNHGYIVDARVTEGDDGVVVCFKPE